MDSTTYFFDLLKITLPALIVAGAIYLLFRQFWTGSNSAA